MASYKLYQRFIGQQPRIAGFKALALTVLAAVVTGCQLYPAPGAPTRPGFSPLASQYGGGGVQLPYFFRIASFNDKRSVEDSPIYTGQLGQIEHFPQQIFTSTFQSNLTHSLYSNKVGNVDMELTHYKLTEFERDFTLSMEVKMTATTDLGKKILAESFTCTRDKHRHPKDLVKIAQDTWKYKTAAPLTQEGWREEITRLMVANCAENVAEQFSQSVINGALNS